MRKWLGVLVGACLLWGFAGAALAELCPKCKKLVFTMDIGKCEVCGGATRSGAFHLCPKCSARLKQCEHCRAPLAGQAGPKDIVLDKQANGKTVTVAKGQRIVIRLAGNPTTGYSWALAKLEGDAVEQVGKVQYEPKRVPRGIVGSGGTFRFTFKAVKLGKATLRLAYRRPWEKKKPPAETFTLTVQVKSPAKKK